MSISVQIYLKNGLLCSVQMSLKVCQLSDATSLLLLRLDFIRVLCSHEHFFPLNLPFGTPLTPSGMNSPTSSISSAASHR